MKAKKSTVIPIALLVYLAAMAWIGYEAYASGQRSALEYFGIIGITILVIVLLHFSLKRRERLKSEREADINSSADRSTAPLGQIDKPDSNDNDPRTEK